jgi:acetyltransferase-like isoleucine patch superfamily enzyme
LHAASLKGTPGARIHASKPIVIEDDVWLASGVIVSAGSRVGAGTIVGANSVVINNIQAKVFAAGSPAVAIKNLEI